MAKYDFEKSIGFVVKNTAKAFQKTLDLELRKNAGVTIGQLRVVVTLIQYPGSTQKEIAEKVEVEGATLVPVIDKMEKEGLLKRRPDSKDRRVNRIFLTPKADSLWNSMMECLLHVRKIAAKDIGEDELETTLETLRKISKNLSAYLEVGNMVAIPGKNSE